MQVDVPGIIIPAAPPTTNKSNTLPVVLKCIECESCVESQIDGGRSTISKNIVSL